MFTNFLQNKLSLRLDGIKNPNLTQIKIVALGDSLTFGFPYTPSNSWVYLVQEFLGITLYNKGINGDTTGQMLKRFNRDCLAFNPSHVIITGGSNDAFAKKDVDQVMANIINMIEAALKNGITPIIGLPPPLNPPGDEKFLALYREEMKEFAAEKGIGVINFYNEFINNEGRMRTELFIDTAHPSLEGQKIMAAAAFQYLKEFLGI